MDRFLTDSDAPPRSPESQQSFTLSTQSESPSFHLQDGSQSLETEGDLKESAPSSTTVDSVTVPASALRRCGDSWSLEDDLWLDAHRVSMSVRQLAAHFQRNEGAIRSRVKHLQNPQHSSFVRLQKEYSSTGRNESGEVILAASSVKQEPGVKQANVQKEPGVKQEGVKQELGADEDEGEEKADPVDDVLNLSLKQSE